MNLPHPVRLAGLFSILLLTGNQSWAQGPAEGLDSPLTWTVAGTPAWGTVSSTTALAGGDVARARQADDSTMETVITGPATVSFSWRLVTPDGKGVLALEMEGKQMAILRRETGWQEVQVNVPSGNHTLRLRATGMGRVPGAAAEADQFVVNAGAHLAWLDSIGDSPEALWVVTGSGKVAAETVSLSGLDDGKVATVRGTAGDGRTSMVRLVQGPARLEPFINSKGGYFVGKDLDSVETPRVVSAPSAADTWSGSPIVVGPGLHRVEWAHYYWSAMADEKDPYPQTVPASVVPKVTDVATLAALAVVPLTLDSAVMGGLQWTSTGSHPFVPTLGPQEVNSLDRIQKVVLGVEAPAAGQNAKLSTVITGPAEVTVNTFFSGPAGDTLRVLAGGEVKFQNSYEGSTGLATFEIPAGPVTVEVEWTSGSVVKGWPRKAGVTGVTIQGVIPEAVKAALDAPAGVTFYSPSPAEWSTDTATPRSGTAAWTHPVVTTSPDYPQAIIIGFPELSAWVDGPSVLTYWRRGELPAGSTMPFPGMIYYNPGEFSWQPVTVAVPAGRHRLVWYSPRSSQGYFPNTSRYYLDSFSVQPDTGVGAVSLEDALDTPGKTLTTSGNAVSAGAYVDLALDGQDAVTMTPADDSTPAWVETVVTGPATVVFHSSRSLLATTVDGAFPATGLTETMLDDTLWQRTEFAVAEGEHVVRLTATDPRNPALLDRVTITPQPPALSVADALDAPGRVFTTGGDALWQAQYSSVADDGAAMLAGGAGNGWVGTAVTGPARLEFEWRAGPDYTRTSLEMDGVEIASVTPYSDWEKVMVELPAGAHTLHWIYNNPEGRTGTQPAGLNHLSVTAPPALTLGDAMEAPGQVWLTRGRAPVWEAQTALSHDGVDAAGVALSEDEELTSSDLQTTVTGPALAKFWWRKDGEGAAYFQIDGRTGASLSVANEWQEVTTAVPPGSHVLKWTRPKANFFDPRSGVVVDDFRMEPAPATFSLGEVLNAPALTWRTSPGRPWEYALRNLPGGGQEPAATSPSAPGESSWIETDVTGPAVLSFLFLDDSAGFSTGSLLVDGEMVRLLGGANWPDDAVAVRWPIPAGTHTVRWQWDEGSSVPLGDTKLNRLMIDRVTVSTGRPELGTLFPITPVTEDFPWTVQPAPGGSGFRAESNPVPTGEFSTLRMTVPGNRELAFRTGWAGLRTNRLGGCFLDLDDDTWYGLHGLSGFGGDTLNSVWYLPAGQDRQLSWVTSSGQGTIDAMFLDQVSLSTPAYPLGEALGLPQKAFLGTGAGRWYGQTAARHNSAGAAVSSTGDGSLITMFTGPGTVSWWWQCEGAPATAQSSLVVYPYGIASSYASHSGSFDWERRQVVLPPGATFRLEWKAVGAGAGRLLLDDVNFQEDASDTYTTWAIAKGGGENAAMDADPDGDGQTNLMEFAFGSDPNSKRSAYKQDIRIVSGQAHLRLTLPAYDTTGVNYDLEFSPDLKNWSLLQRIPGGPGVVDKPVVCALPEAAAGSRGFVRLKVGYGEN